MKKTLVLFGVVAMFAMMMVFTSCATTSAWWAGSWIWGPAVLLAPANGETVENTVILEGTSAKALTGTLVENGEEFEMTEIDVSKKGFISFVANGTEKEGEFNFTEKTIKEISE
ncbi:MAG TPA: hypothetical protein PK466_12585 [Thermotogota bacterium]|nr:hypothetical protein [Thermotogota bacterium]HPJ89958.1 hypothetical protein [Thermotogota bacterium]HPR97158.1 hypothetical protein [Thermotogota bacterium]